MVACKCRQTMLISSKDLLIGGQKFNYFVCKNCDGVMIVDMDDFRKVYPTLSEEDKKVLLEKYGVDEEVVKCGLSQSV